MLGGRFLVWIARWISRVLSGMAERVDRIGNRVLPERARPDRTLAALAERFPSAPLHWLRAVAARMPVSDTTDHLQHIGRIPARPPARDAPVRPGSNSVAALATQHPALPSHRVRPVRVLRKRAAIRRGRARLLLPGFWRRLRMPFNLLAQGPLPSSRLAPPLIGEAQEALTSSTSKTNSVAPQTAPEQRRELLFGAVATEDMARFDCGYPEPWFDTQSDFAQADDIAATYFSQTSLVEPTQTPSVYSMPNDEPHSAAMWPSIVQLELRTASHFPETGLARPRPEFVAIGDDRFDLWERRALKTSYAVTNWPVLPPSDAFTADAESSPAAYDALRYEQTVGRWSA